MNSTKSFDCLCSSGLTRPLYTTVPCTSIPCNWSKKKITSTWADFISYDIILIWYQYHYPTASPIDIISSGVGWSTKAWIYLRASQASLVPALGELMKDVDDHSIPQTIGTYSGCGCAGGDINLNGIGHRDQKMLMMNSCGSFRSKQHSLLLFFHVCTLPWCCLEMVLSYAFSMLITLPHFHIKTMTSKPSCHWCQVDRKNLAGFLSCGLGNSRDIEFLFGCGWDKDLLQRCCRILSGCWKIVSCSNLFILKKLTCFGTILCQFCMRVCFDQQSEPVLSRPVLCPVESFQIYQKQAKLAHYTHI